MKRYPDGETFRPGNIEPGHDATDFRIIQIHPTLRCNLRCKHCYSSSGPAFKSYSDVKTIERFLSYARTWGFNTTSVSGGEPFLYPQLEQLLVMSHELGNKNIAASNGMLLRSDKAKRILSHLDLLAISIDGKPNFHDMIRDQPGAFRKMEEGLEVLRDLDVPFGLIHTVTEDSWRHLLWLSEFAVRHGARLLQLHPLELTGRALKEFNHMVPSIESLYKTYIMAHYLQEHYQGILKIHIDLLHRQTVEHHPSLVSYYGSNFHLDASNFSNVVKCLVVDDEGNIFPMSFGFHPAYCIGNIQEAGKRDLFGDFITSKGEALYAVISKAFSEICEGTGHDLFVWTEMIVNISHSMHPAATDSKMLLPVTA